MTRICIFDIETVPDIEGFSRLRGLDARTPAAEKYDIIKAERRAEVGNEFMRHHLHKIVAIAVCFIVQEHNAPPKIYIDSLGNKHQDNLNQDDNKQTNTTHEVDEKAIINHFFHGIETHQPTLVSWNGSGFDLPVLNYRALIHGISAPSFWDVGQHKPERKWQNYLSRYQWQHIDLMDVLSFYQPRATASLSDMAVLCGFPGKLGIDGGDVLALYQAGNLAEIEQYCETDVMTTYLLYLRFCLLRGELNPETYRLQVAHFHDYLQQRATQKPHYRAFLEAWQYEAATP